MRETVSDLSSEVTTAGLRMFIQPSSKQVDCGNWSGSLVCSTRPAKGFAKRFWGFWPTRRGILFNLTPDRLLPMFRRLYQPQADLHVCFKELLFSNAMDCADNQSRVDHCWNSFGRPECSRKLAISCLSAMRLGSVLTSGLGCHPMRLFSLDASKPFYCHLRSWHTL